MTQELKSEKKVFTNAERFVMSQNYDPGPNTNFNLKFEWCKVYIPINMFNNICNVLDDIYGKDAYKTFRVTNSTDPRPGSVEFILYLISNSDTHIAISQWNMVQLPGCCGVCVTTGEYVERAHRGYGLGTILSTCREFLAMKAGYSVLLCTDVNKNTPQKKILNNNKWENIHRFRNSKTGNVVNIHTKTLIESEDYEQSVITAPSLIKRMRRRIGRFFRRNASSFY